MENVVEERKKTLKFFLYSPILLIWYWKKGKIYLFLVCIYLVR